MKANKDRYDGIDATGSDTVPVQKTGGLFVPDDGKLLEWLAVLCVGGIPYNLRRDTDYWMIEMKPDDVDAAYRLISEHEERHRGWPPSPGGGALVSGTETTGIWPAFWGAYSVGLMYFWLGPYRAAAPLLQAAGAQRSAIRAGEWWRTVTALMVHADTGHLVANLLFLFVFAMQVCRLFGAGLGWFIILAGGALGNTFAALTMTRDGVGVGASTACFAALGALAAGGMAVRLRGAAPWRDLWRRAWMPPAAGLALLGMTGASPGTDIMAHLFGFLAGAGLGAGAAVVRHVRPRYMLPVLSAGVLLLSWIRVWQAAFGS